MSSRDLDLMLALPDRLSGIKFNPPRSADSNVEYYEHPDGTMFMKTTALIPVDDHGLPILPHKNGGSICLQAETLLDGICSESYDMDPGDFSELDVEIRYQVEFCQSDSDPDLDYVDAPVSSWG